MKTLLLLPFLLLLAGPLLAQTVPTDSTLVGLERAKWVALSKAEFGKHPEWLAPDFFHIGYMPNGSLNRYQKGQSVPNPGLKPWAGGTALPAATFRVHDFHVLTASPDVKIVTYIANGPLDLFVTSTWVRRGDAWQTLFYQATAYQPQAPAAPKAKR